MFLAEPELDYGALRARFAPGETLRLDAPYRLAHLPLVAPWHPDARHEAPGSDYRSGRYVTPRRSLVIPIPWAVLERHELIPALRACAAAPKIAWHLVERRRPIAHATIVGGVAAPLPEQLAGAPPFRLKIGGPLVGDRNRGRLYLPCYPERTARGDPIAALQALCGGARTGIYLMGFLNLVDHLDARETADLDTLLTRYQRATIAVIEVARLWLLETNDDLALSGRVTQVVALGGAPGSADGMP